MRALDLAVRLLPAPCGVLGAPNAGAGVGAAKRLPDAPPGAKLKPPLGAGVAGTAMKKKDGEKITIDFYTTANFNGAQKIRG